MNFSVQKSSFASVPSSVERWLYSTDHKDIGIIDFIFVAFVGSLGTVMLNYTCMESSYPSVQVLAENNQLYKLPVTAHVFLISLFMISQHASMYGGPSVRIKYKKLFLGRWYPAWSMDFLPLHNMEFVILFLWGILVLIGIRYIIRTARVEIPGEQALGHSYPGNSPEIRMLNIALWARGALARAFSTKTFNWIAFMPLVLFKDTPLIGLALVLSIFILKTPIILICKILCERMIMTGWPPCVYWGARMRFYGESEKLFWISTCIVFFILALVLYGRPISKVGLLFPPLLFVSVWQPYLWIRLVLIIQGILFIWIPHSGPRILFKITAITRKLYLVPILFSSALLAAVLIPTIALVVLKVAIIFYIVESFGWLILLQYADLNCGSLEYDENNKFGPQEYFFNDQDYVVVRGAYIPWNISKDVAEHYWGYCFIEFFGRDLFNRLYPNNITGINFNSNPGHLTVRAIHSWALRPNYRTYKDYKLRLRDWFFYNPLWEDDIY